jgi:hypothetical protein
MITSTVYEGCVEGLCLSLSHTHTRIHILRHYATSRKVAGSIPDKVIGFFN